MTAGARKAWVGYLRVSTPEQAEKDLSIPAQRKAVAAYAERNGKSIDCEYLEPGRSGTDINRKAFRQMLEDVLRPGSDIGVIVVHHTSRFTRNATQARVVKEQLRRKGVKVMSVSQEIKDDPIGQFIEGIFECIDQYESELNGMRTSAAMNTGSMCQRSKRRFGGLAGRKPTNSVVSNGGRIEFSLRSVTPVTVNRYRMSGLISLSRSNSTTSFCAVASTTNGVTAG